MKSLLLLAFLEEIPPLLPFGRLHLQCRMYIFSVDIGIKDSAGGFFGFAKKQLFFRNGMIGVLANLQYSDLSMSVCGPIGLVADTSTEFDGIKFLHVIEGIWLNRFLEHVVQEVLFLHFDPFDYFIDI